MKKLDLIRNAIDKTQKEGSGKLGVYFEDLKSGESVSLNSNALFPTASVFKIFILAELFRQIEEGKYTLQQRFPLTDDIKAAGSGVFLHINNEIEPTLYDYALLMMILSDNTCADFLYHLVGKENIAKNVIAPLGLENTKVDFSCSDLFTYYCDTEKDTPNEEKMAAYLFNDYLNSPWYLCTTEKNDQTTPAEISKMLKVIYNGEWCSKETCEQMLSIMKKCQTNSRIPKYLPKGTAVAHKTGTFDRLANDSGIVYTPKGDYILALFYNGNLAEAEEYYEKNTKGYYGDELLARLSGRDL